MYLYKSIPSSLCEIFALIYCVYLYPLLSTSDVRCDSASHIKSFIMTTQFIIVLFVLTEGETDARCDIILSGYH